MPDQVVLSRHFALDEFCRSDTATRLGIDMHPPAWAIQNLGYLCEHVLEPLRIAVGLKIIITSGYRPLDLNRLVGGHKTSQHVQGQAADIQVPGLTSAELQAFVRKQVLPVDQCIDEFGQWLHVSYDASREQRNQYLRAVRRGGVVYEPV